MQILQVLKNALGLIVLSFFFNFNFLLKYKYTQRKVSISTQMMSFYKLSMPVRAHRLGYKTLPTLQEPFFYHHHCHPFTTPRINTFLIYTMISFFLVLFLCINEKKILCLVIVDWRQPGSHSLPRCFPLNVLKRHLKMSILSNKLL